MDSTSRVSCGEELAIPTARGRPAPSATAMILVPLPRFAFPTLEPHFGPCEGAVDEGLGEVEASPLVEILREAVEDPLDRPVSEPLLEAAMAGLVRRIATGQILPRSPRTKDPEDPVQDVPRITPRSATAVRTSGRLGNQRFNRIPLSIGENHAALLRGGWVIAVIPVRLLRVTRG